MLIDVKCLSAQHAASTKQINETYMNIKNILSWTAAGAVTAVTLCARIYQLLRTGETPIETYSRNRLLNSTLSNARCTINEPRTGNLVGMLMPAGILLLNAYATYTTRPVPFSRHSSARMPTLTAHPTSTTISEECNEFEKRLNNAKFSLDDIPEEFIDPISYRIMIDPVVATTSCKNKKGESVVTSHFYDKSTYDQLKGVCPENRLKFLSCHPARSLKSKIESFVKQKEKKENVLRAAH